MSLLIERIVRINGEERRRSQMVAEHERIEAITIPVLTVNPPLLTDAKVELELTFDPPLTTGPGREAIIDG